MEKQNNQEKLNQNPQPTKQKEVKENQEEPNMDDALDDILNQNKLNITDEGEDDDSKFVFIQFFDPQVQQEYEKLMKDMGGEGGFGSMMENLLSAINPNGQQKGEESNEPNSKEEEQFKSKMNDILKGLEGGNLEDVANKLLNQFMDKQILEQPLQQTKKAYEQIFSNPEKVKATEDDLDRYRKQYFVVKDILAQLQKNPNDKEALIKKFEEMQKYGSPPEGINVSM